MTALTEPLAIDAELAKPDTLDLETADINLSNQKITKVCFVCTGNTCRSPMAMAVFNHLFKDKYALSLGLYPNIGEPISENAVTALTQHGIPSTPLNRYERHRADVVTEQRLADCDKIIGISEAHTLELLGRFPRLAGKIMSMPRSIADPYGGSIEVYKHCLDEIEDSIKELFYV